jgi:mRNA interferase MazF
LVDLGHGVTTWLVVSNNSRNRNLRTVIAARVATTGTQATLPTVVPMASADPLTGHVMTDDLVQLFHDELTKPAGSLSGSTMKAVSAALRIALP